MADWFAPKKYGYGAGLPIAWQGWALLLAYLALVITAARLVEKKPLPAITIIVSATLVLVAVIARTTRGGFRWRWGSRD